MGQAKLKGNRSARVAAALKKIEVLKPDHVICNNCKVELPELITLDTRNMHGVEAAFGAHCQACDSVTWAVLGDPDAVSALYEMMENEAGTPLKTGTAPIPDTPEER